MRHAPTPIFQLSGHTVSFLLEFTIVNEPIEWFLYFLTVKLNLIKIQIIKLPSIKLYIYIYNCKFEYI